MDHDNPPSLCAERAAYAEREARRGIERMAHACARRLGRQATAVEFEGDALSHYRLDAREAREVAEEAQRLLGDRARAGTHRSTQELLEESMAKTNPTEIRDATRQVLAEQPEIDRTDAFQLVQQRTGSPILQSSWEVGYFYPLRKELRGKFSDPLPTRRPKRARPTAPIPPQNPMDAPAGPSLARSHASLQERLQARLAELNAEASEIRTALAVLSRFVEEKGA